MGINLFNAFMGDATEAGDEKKKKPPVETPAEDTSMPRKPRDIRADYDYNELTRLFNDKKGYGPSLGELVGEALGTAVQGVRNSLKPATKEL